MGGFFFDELIRANYYGRILFIGDLFMVDFLLGEFLFLWAN